MSNPTPRAPNEPNQTAASTESQTGTHAPDWAVLALVCLAQFMVILDISVVNVALPSIRRDLGFSATGLQWVVNAYTLTFAGFLLLGGRAADLYGRRLVFIVGLATFTAASLAGGLAQNEAMLVGARAVQGLGAAILAPATLTILTTHFREPSARARAIGVWSAVAAGGGAAGAVLGGVLTDLLSWRWILFINIPIGVIGLIGARLILVESYDRSRAGSLDVAGAVTVTAGLVTLVYAIVESTDWGWSSAKTIGTLVLAAALLALFAWIEVRVAKAPLVPLGIFRSRSLVGANASIFLLASAMFAMWFFLSLYMQGVLGYSPLKAGFAFLPQTIAIAIGAQISSRLVTRIGPRPLIVFAGLLAAVGMAWLSRITPDGGYFTHILWPSVLVTLGLGLAFTPVTFAATAGVPMNQAGLASGLINTTRQVGGSIGLAVLATVAVDTTRSAAAGSVNAALTAGYSRAFDVSVWLLAGAAAAALIVPPVTRTREAVGVAAPAKAGA
jgi:EmrB/QacA subfamily drug resistance transporter